MKILKPLNRRTLLRSTGIGIGLPLLEAMAPVGKTAFAADAKPTRFMACYTPCGFLTRDFKTKNKGRNYDLSPTLKPLEAFKNDILVIRNATNQAQHPMGDQGAHAHGTGAFLTGTKLNPRFKTAAKQAASVDQIIANKLPRETPIKSLHLNPEEMKASASANCDTGWACAYVYHISWNSQSNFNPNISDPVKLFNELYGSVGGNGTAAPEAGADQSILDFVKDDINALNKKLGIQDKNKMDEYLTAIRDLEVGLNLGNQSGDQGACANIQSPERVTGTKSKDAQKRIERLADLSALALQCDATRIITFMFDRGASTRSYADQFSGHSKSHHNYSHHGNNADFLKRMREIEKWEIQRLAYLLGKLKNTKDPQGDSLLDSLALFFSSEVNEGDKHRNDDMPLIMAGRANGQLKTGQAIDLAANRKDFCNIYESVIKMMGINNHGKVGDYGGGINNDIFA